HELIVWTGNFVTTGIGDLPLGQEPEPSDYCWIEQTCDFYSAAITCLNIRSWIDFELLVPESMFQSCSRPYVFEFYSAGGINFDHFPNEYRPTIGLRSVEMNNIEGLDFTHDYNGGPWGFTTVSIDGDGSELEFIVNATDDLMTVDFSALPIPDHQTNQHQYRLFGGHAVDVDGCQQIGMEGDIQFGNYPLTMNEDAIDAKFEYVNFLSVDNPLLNDVEHIDDPNNEHVGDDLQIHRVGFYATDDGPEPVLSSNGGSITGQEIHYINPNTHIGGLYGGVTTTTGFFVIPENTPEVTVTQVSLIKMVNGIQIGTPIVGVSHNSDPGTLFFHRDHSGLCVNDFLNCAWDEHLFRVHPDNQWFLVFDYNLEQCPIDADGNNENTFEFNYFFGTACGTDGDPNSPNFDMTRCQTCLSYFGNCADCNCSDNGIVDSHSIFTEYSGEMDAYVDQVQLYLPNALLNADINDVSATCAPEYTVNLAVPMPDGALYMDAENIILTIQYPDNWINLPVVTLDCLNCLVDVIQTEPGLAEVSLTQDNSPLVISSGETIS
ncbi:MAG: hypothetical protein ACPGED_09070, partial [Flavobacteriales bacterium]